VAPFYRALTQSGSGKERRIFNVSSSKWNLYDLLTDFIDFQGIPKDPLHMSDQKLKIYRFRRSGKDHNQKLERIRALFELYHEQDFILVGDSRQKDPEIYLAIASMFPSRVKVIYIRLIKDRKRNRRLERLREEARDLGTEIVPVRTTIKAAEHAAGIGIIRKARLEQIRKGKVQDELVNSSERAWKSGK
jgi:phosphatidate phosphatase APP1